MINVKEFYEILKQNEIDFFTGVPDSLLKSFCAYLSDNLEGKNHIIAANEGACIALCAGHYLATGKPALAYMQNSGLGNAINPILSLADEEVYGIPLLLLIGQRGEEGTKDEPQHIKQGKVTDKILDAASIEYAFLPKDSKRAKDTLIGAIKYIKENKKPFALIIKKDTFEKYESKKSKNNNYKLTRYEAICEAASILNNNDIIVASTGFISRELYEFREAAAQMHDSDFLTVGSMGHADSVALKIALEKPDRTVYCFDGDGSIIMHTGTLSTIGKCAPDNFKHIIFNNMAHDSVGAQPTSADVIDFCALGKSMGYKSVYRTQTQQGLKKALKKFKDAKSPSLLEIKVKCGAKSNLGRPKEHPRQMKKVFMDFLNDNIVFEGKDSLSNIKSIIKNHNKKSALIFCGKKSYSKIKKRIEKQLQGLKIQTYSNFSTNPKAKEVDLALKILGGFDIIIAVGGGSVLDFAKLFRFCYDNKISTKEALDNKEFAVKNTILTAISTTAGTGAEATKFAVIYVEGKKHSFEHKLLLPDYVILDGNLVKNNPPYLKACSGADALCQAIESYWSINSTKQSKFYAKKAMELCRDYLVKYVKSNKKEYADKMILAAFLSGRAINISKTTASHALSYKITTDYNIPHGHAVSLSIAQLMIENEKALNVLDPRGAQYVKDTIRQIRTFLNIDESQSYFSKLFSDIGLEQNFKKLGINNIDEIASDVNPQRLKNNPVRLDFETLKSLFQ